MRRGLAQQLRLGSPKKKGRNIAALLANRS